MRTPSSSHALLTAYAVCFLSIVTLIFLLNRQGGPEVEQPTSSPTPTVSASVTPSPEPSSSPTASPTTLPTPTPSPSASVSSELPAAVGAFYDAYQTQRAADVFAQFTEPTTDADRDLLSLLRDGKDLDGIPGGPTLFQSASVTVTITKVTVTNTTGARVEVEETIQTEETVAVRTRFFTMVDGKIAAYTKLNDDGKYSGFFN